MGTRVRLNLQGVEQYMSRNGIRSLNELGRRAGLSDSALYKARVGSRAIGGSVIAKLLSTYPDASFDEFFVLEDTRMPDKQGEGATQ